MKHIDINHIAKLARLELTQEEKAQYEQEIERVLDHMGTIASVNVPEGTEPMAYTGERTNVMREDEPHETFTPDEALAHAPAKRDGQLVVPPVVEQGV